jgi:predicted nucleotidyltransferase
MEQIIATKTILILLKGPNHARSVAKSLGINHMTAMRALRSLVEANVLDYSVTGRNKVYALKTTLEARNAVLMAEIHRLDLLVERYPFLRRIMTKILDDERVGLAVLFGSYAKGTATKNSDIDLYVQTQDPNLKKDLEGLSSKLSVKIGNYDTDNPLIKEIQKDHVIVKGVEMFYGRSGLSKTAQ